MLILKIINRLKRLAWIIIWRLFFLVTRQSMNKTVVISPRSILGLGSMKFGDNIRILAGARLEVYKQRPYEAMLKIGSNVSINYDIHIGCINKIVIGDNTLIASDVFITDHSHGDPHAPASDLSYSDMKLFSPGPVIIEKNCWIGEKASIMPNVQIGAGSIVGANSVVTKSFPPNSIIAGVPAKLIRIK